MLYALGEQDRIVGISGFTVRPAIARKEKPKVSAFTSAKIGEILKLQPDFVIGFSDIQADIAGELIRARHRGVDQQPPQRRRASSTTSAGSARWSAPATRPMPTPTNCSAGSMRSNATRRRCRAGPKVYFEEWDEPLITGIRWVAELVRIAGGDDIFPERAAESLAQHRILDDPDEVVRRAPDIILGSWCGKKFRPEKVAARPGWDAIPAVRDGELHEIKSPIILQPGPAALTDGVREIARDHPRLGSSRKLEVASWQARRCGAGRRRRKHPKASARIEIAAELHRRSRAAFAHDRRRRSAACPAAAISTVPT